MKKAILIDVDNKTITNVIVTETDGSYLEAIYAHVKCNMVEIVNIGNNDIYVNEEGLLDLSPDSNFFIYKGVPQPLAGNGLIMGYDDATGDSIDTTLSIDEVAENVLFYNVYEVVAMSK